MLHSNKVKKADGSQPDDAVVCFRREGVSIVIGCIEPLSGTTFPERAYAVLKNMSDNQHWRTKLVSDLTTVMAFARLADGEKLDVNVNIKSGENTISKKESVGIIGYWKLADNQDVENITLLKPLPIVVNLIGARISEVLTDQSSDDALCIQSAVTIEGHQRYAIKTRIPCLFSGESCSYEIKQIRSGLPFSYAVTEGEYEKLDLISCPGRREYQSAERDLYLKQLSK